MNVNIIITRLEFDVNAITTPNNDGSYTIAVNSRLSAQAQRKAILHEISHIVNDDFSDFQHASIIERMLNESNYLESNLSDINFYYHIV